MINYTSQYQTQFEDFSNLCQLELDPNNRWIQLGALLPWDRMVEVYAKRFSANMGARAVNPRWVIGAFIIKHKLRLTDEETLLSISENPYMRQSHPFVRGSFSWAWRPTGPPSCFRPHCSLSCERGSVRTPLMSSPER
jgi:hypothetical protein